jgi:hypothetical protein
MSTLTELVEVPAGTFSITSASVAWPIADLA